jgi:hypothetical protein
MAIVKKLSGDVEMIARLRRTADGFPKLLGDDLYRELKDVELPEVIANTPMDTGALRNSERVEGPVITKTSVSASILAGDDTVFYAVYVHEDPDAHHPIGDWKYIERPLKEAGPHLMDRIAAKRALERAAS